MSTKQLHITTILLIESSESRTLRTQNAGDVIEKHELARITSGTQKGIATLEDSVTVS